jgi:hypothetical protein
MFFDNIKVRDITDGGRKGVKIAHQYVWDHKLSLIEELNTGKFIFINTTINDIPKEDLARRLRIQVNLNSRLTVDNLTIIELDKILNKVGIETVDYRHIAPNLSFKCVNPYNSKLEARVSISNLLSGVLPQTIINLTHSLKYFNDLDNSQIHRILNEFGSRGITPVYSLSELSKAETLLRSLQDYDPNNSQKDRIKAVLRSLGNLNYKFNKKEDVIGISCYKFIIKGCGFSISVNQSGNYILMTDLPGYKSFYTNSYDGIDGLNYLLNRLNSLSEFQTKIESFILSRI